MSLYPSLALGPWAAACAWAAAAAAAAGCAPPPPRRGARYSNMDWLWLDSIFSRLPAKWLDNSLR